MDNQKYIDIINELKIENEELKGIVRQKTEDEEKVKKAVFIVSFLMGVAHMGLGIKLGRYLQRKEVK